MRDDGPDLSTSYLGLELAHPIVPSASPLSRDVATVRRLEDLGAPAIVMYSLFEEEVTHEEDELAHYLDQGTESFAESLSYFPDVEPAHQGPDEYLEHLRRIEEAVDIPVIASLNGVTPGGWTRYAGLLQEAGASAIELNVYYIPTSPDDDGERVERRYLDVLKAVKSRVSIPIAMKLSPFFSSLPAFAKRLEDSGANGLVLFNRFYQPDIDLENLDVYPNVKLSTSDALRLPLRWIAILHGRIDVSLAATSGVHRFEDVVKLLMVGADVTMVCSALLRYGGQRLPELVNGLRQWLFDHEYESVEQLKGSMSHRTSQDPSVFERANYRKALNSYRPVPGVLKGSAWS